MVGAGPKRAVGVIATSAQFGQSDLDSSWRLGCFVGSLRGVAIGVALDDEDVRVVKQPVHGRAGEQRVSKERRPFVEVAVGGEDKRSFFVALADELVQIHGLIVFERPQAEIIDNQKVDCGQARQFAIIGIIRAPSAKLGEQLVGGEVQHGVTSYAGTVTDGLSDMALADPGLADQAKVFVAVDKCTGGQVEDFGFGYLGIEGEIEILERLGMVEAGATESEVELFRLTAVYFVGQKPQKKLGRREVVVASLPHAQLERLQDSGQAQFFEDGNQFISWVHHSSPSEAVQVR